MEAVRAADLAVKMQLDLGDWVEITGVNTYRLGLYSIDSDGVRFHPNKESDKPGWSEEQNKEAERLAPEGMWYETKRHAEEANASQLTFPCTPKELVEFALTRDVSGDLHGLLPGLFIAAVYEAEAQQGQRAPTTEQQGTETLKDIKRAQPNPEKPLHPRERKSIEQIIAAIAAMAELDLTRPYKADETLRAVAARHKLELPSSPETVAKFLKSAAARAGEDQSH